MELKNVREARCWKRQFVEIRLASDVFYKVGVGGKINSLWEGRTLGEKWEEDKNSLKQSLDSACQLIQHETSE